MHRSMAEIEIALSEIRVMKATLQGLETTLEALLTNHIKDRLSQLPSCDVPTSEHRRAHRAGHAPKIDSDPELQAFIRARIDRLTFEQIASDVKAHFPPERGVGKSAIHAWWKRDGMPGRSAIR